MMKSKSIAALLFSGLLAGSASAAPLFNIAVEASLTPAGPYSSTVTAVPGATYYFRVIGQESALNTSNTQSGTTRTITSYGTNDGSNSLSFNLADAGANPSQASFTSVSLATPSTVPAASKSWNGSSSANAGTIASADGGASNTVTGIRPIHAAGEFSGGSVSDVIEIGQFTISPNNILSGLSSQIAATFGGTLSTLRINNGTAIAINSTTEGGSDPVLSFTPLTLSTVPEPTTLALAGLASFGLLGRRRKA